LFSNEEVDRVSTPMDCLCAQLQKKLSFEKGDRDVVILHHIFGIKWKDGKKVPQQQEKF
jgi:saccharopine dehydrogenase (NADP+, L-glutamate forming)